MCNEAYRRAQIGEVVRGWGQTRIPLRFPEGKPNFPPLDSIRITDRVEIIRAAPRGGDDGPAAEMVTAAGAGPVLPASRSIIVALTGAPSPTERITAAA